MDHAMTDRFSSFATILYDLPQPPGLAPLAIAAATISSRDLFFVPPPLGAALAPTAGRLAGGAPLLEAKEPPKTGFIFPAPDALEAFTQHGGTEGRKTEGQRNVQVCEGAGRHSMGEPVQE